MNWWQIVENEEVYNRCKAIKNTILDFTQIGNDLLALVHRLNYFMEPKDLPQEQRVNRIATQLQILADEFGWDLAKRTYETDDARYQRMITIFLMFAMIYFIGVERGVPLPPDPYEGDKL